MKFLCCKGEQYHLELTTEEKDVLLHLLSLYPLVPESYHHLSLDKKFPKRTENQQLLDEALKAHREENQQAVLALLAQPERFTAVDSACRGQFTRAELEWLLQVVNDVRVGCWIALGSPGYEPKKKGRPSKAAMRHALFMELSGAFEMFFLGIISGEVPPAEPE